MWGCQLWVNLPAGEKMIAPRYQEFSEERIPSEQRAQCRLKIVAGLTSEGTEGAVRDAAVSPRYFDIRLQAGAHFMEPVPESHSAFIFVVEGAVGIPGQDGATAVPAGTLAVLDNGNRIEVTNGGTASRLLLITGRALNEPVARSGPFVMNTREELMQAFADYRAGRF